MSDFIKEEVETIFSGDLEGNYIGWGKSQIRTTGNEDPGETTEVVSMPGPNGLEN